MQSAPVRSRGALRFRAEYHSYRTYIRRTCLKIGVAYPIPLSTLPAIWRWRHTSVGQFAAVSTSITAWNPNLGLSVRWQWESVALGVDLIHVRSCFPRSSVFGIHYRCHVA